MAGRVKKQEKKINQIEVKVKVEVKIEKPGQVMCPVMLTG
jgi:hypothetical protein